MILKWQNKVQTFGLYFLFLLGTPAFVQADG
jgi:hypothetical protein